jgi:hypothetical protein
VWDVFYYVVLKVLLGWPESLATWDVLFLIPVPWIGPVWAPVVVSVALIAVGTHLFRTAERPRRVRPLDWAVEVAGGVIVIVSFCLDWRVVIEARMPGRFAAEIFWAGFLLALGWFLWRERQERAYAVTDASSQAR